MLSHTTTGPVATLTIPPKSHSQGHSSPPYVRCPLPCQISTLVSMHTPRCPRPLPPLPPFSSLASNNLQLHLVHQLHHHQQPKQPHHTKPKEITMQTPTKPSTTNWPTPLPCLHAPLQSHNGRSPCKHPPNQPYLKPRHLHRAPTQGRHLPPYRWCHTLSRRLKALTPLHRRAWTTVATPPPSNNHRHNVTIAPYSHAPPYPWPTSAISREPPLSPLRVHQYQALQLQLLPAAPLLQVMLPVMDPWWHLSQHLRRRWQPRECQALLLVLMHRAIFYMLCVLIFF